MTIELVISFIAMIFGLAGLIFGVICLLRYRSCHILFEIQSKQLEETENVLTEYKKLLQSNSQKIADNTRLIAWLETCVPQPKKAESESALRNSIL